MKKYFRDFFPSEDPFTGRRLRVLDVAPVRKEEVYLAIEEVG